MKWRVAHVIYMHIPFSVRALTSSTYEATPCISPDAYNQAKFNSNITSYIAIKKNRMFVQYYQTVSEKQVHIVYMWLLQLQLSSNCTGTHNIIITIIERHIDVLHTSSYNQISSHFVYFHDSPNDSSGLPRTYCEIKMSEQLLNI